MKLVVMIIKIIKINDDLVIIVEWGKHGTLIQLNSLEYNNLVLTVPLPFRCTLGLMSCVLSWSSVWSACGDQEGDTA